MTMYIVASKLANLILVESDSGKVVGVSKQVVYDELPSRILGLMVGHYDAMLPIDQITSILQDKIVVDDVSVITSLNESEYSDLVSNTYNSPIGSELTINDGIELGLVEDVAVDAKNGAIIGYLVSSEVMQELYPKQKYIPVTESLVLSRGGEQVALPSINTNLVQDQMNYGTENSTGDMKDFLADKEDIQNLGMHLDPTDYDQLSSLPTETTNVRATNDYDDQENSEGSYRPMVGV
jgi:uncharacterized protein YrrD